MKLYPAFFVVVLHLASHYTNALEHEVGKKKIKRQTNIVCLSFLMILSHDASASQQPVALWGGKNVLLLAFSLQI